MEFYARRRRALLIVSVLAVALMILFEGFSVKSDGNAGDSEKSEITFSRESGFYEEPFALELSAEEGTIYYTLDGSVPDESSLKYERPISIKDATENENVYSMITEVSVAFDREAVEKMSIEEPFPGYQTPEYFIDKATVVRAALYDKAGQCRDRKTASYFVGFSDKDGYEGMNVLSIVTDPSHLFDYENGIYVSGKTYDDYLNEYRNKGIYSFREAYWSQWLANYKNRGIKWEREADCQFFDAFGKPVWEQKCGIRIHGTSTRAYNPKSLNLYARKEYDGNKVFETDFFGTGYLPKAVTLFQGGNDTRMKVKDYLVHDAIRGMEVANIHYLPYVMFLNGEYWGVYWLSEKYDAHYLSYYYGVDEDNLVMIKAGNLADGEEEDYNYFRKMLEFCSTCDVTREDNYNKVCDMIDMESYIDYMAIMIYTARTNDWPDGNYGCWRVLKEEDGKYGDGKWRWMVYDFNSPGFEPELDSINWAMNNDPMFENLMTSDSFKRQLFARIEELSDTVFEAKAMEKKIEEYRIFMSEAMRENDRRFYNDDSLEDFHAEIQDLKKFFYERKIYLNSLLDGYRKGVLQEKEES